MAGIGGFLLVLGLLSLFVPVLNVATWPLILVGLVLIIVGVCAGDNSRDAAEGMKNGCGCIIWIVVILIGAVAAIIWIGSKEQNKQQGSLRPVSGADACVVEIGRC